SETGTIPTVLGHWPLPPHPWSVASSAGYTTFLQLSPNTTFDYTSCPMQQASQPKLRRLLSLVRRSLLAGSIAKILSRSFSAVPSQPAPACFTNTTVWPESLSKPGYGNSADGDFHAGFAWQRV